MGLGLLCFRVTAGFIASGSYDKTIKIWNVAIGEEEQTLEGHTDGVSSVVFSSDGGLIASGSYDKTIKVWNVATGINVDSFDSSPATEAVSFIDHDSVLVTSLGHVSVKSRDNNMTWRSNCKVNLDGPEAKAEMDGRLGFGFNDNMTWITAGGPDGRKVLWLPPGFRPGQSAISTERGASVVAIGCPTGRVVIVGFRGSSFLEGV
ncbi:hypothetical protein NXS19_014470 [Fusarium pseudograminearum]|nr:hypothetical protein NXS19_014470 [Fusarium pseudograminearum]